MIRHRVRFQPRLGLVDIKAQVLDPALAEADVAVADLLRHLGLVLARQCEHVVVDIHADDLAGRNVEFIIKELGDFTRTIGKIKPGTRVWLEAPHGHLTHEGHDKAPGIALIAGGVGIAPLIGILRELAATGDPRPTVLLYGNRTEPQIVCGAELQTLSRTHGTEVVHVLSEPPEGWTGSTGMIEAALLRTHFGTEARRNWLYILCGPPPMLNAVEDTLIALGIPSSHILSEQFVYD